MFNKIKKVVSVYFNSMCMAPEMIMMNPEVVAISEHERDINHTLNK